jgi:hypothetical protein
MPCFIVLGNLNLRGYLEMSYCRLYLMMLTALMASGCAGMHYNNKMADVSAGIKSGDITGSIKSLESNNQGSGKNPTDASKGLLYLFEKGELLRLNGDLKNSKITWLEADGLVRGWEDAVKTDPSKLLGDAASFLVNDTARRYDGRDYEKVMLSVELALDHVAMNNWDNARIEIKKMHERQALIAEFQEKKLEKAKADAASKNLKVTSFKELGGYPIETLEAPEVKSLKNSYESAFGNYLAAFVYESLGEASMAAPGYRKAAEMQPNIPLLDGALAGLDQRARKSKAGEVDTLFVIETGMAPAVVSQQIGLLLPIPCRSGLCPELVMLSWPVIRPSIEGSLSMVGIDGKDVPLVMLTSVNAMARRALLDEMPSILVRTSIRAIAKVAAQKATDNATSQASAALGPFGGLISLATKMAVAISEVADERVWRTLPDSFSIARLKLRSGQHKVALQLAGVTKIVDIDVSGKYAVVALRIVGNQVFASLQGGDKSMVESGQVIAAPSVPAIKPVVKL